MIIIFIFAAISSTYWSKWKEWSMIAQLTLTMDGRTCFFQTKVAQSVVVRAGLWGMAWHGMGAVSAFTRATERNALHPPPIADADLHQSTLRWCTVEGSKATSQPCDTHTNTHTLSLSPHRYGRKTNSIPVLLWQTMQTGRWSTERPFPDPQAICVTRHVWCSCHIVAIRFSSMTGVKVKVGVRE